MFSLRKPLLLLTLLAMGVAAGPAAAQSKSAEDRYPGVGRNATGKEVLAWDIDVRPDFKGLPAGSGSVQKGMDVWEAKCASCHGVFGESNEVFSPLVGGTTAEDIKTGHVARLKDPAFPGRTTMMKVATVSTLWDYINRAMPWNAPKSLSTEEVYAVTAYLLNLGGVVPESFTLSDTNIAEVQRKLPNRNGMTTRHALWPGNEFGKGARPDVQATACMSNCGPAPRLRSALPEHASNNHGNLAQQNRLVGAQRGIETDGGASKAVKPAVDKKSGSAAPTALLEKNACMACHGMAQKIVGPAFSEIASKHGGQLDYLENKIRVGGSGVWGSTPMPPQPNLSDADAKVIAQWLAAGAKP
ncbi:MULTISPECIES: c-type cytochrome [Comamonas]|uniref:c-type cytochrome n=1 Tax=Comamonas TaxID=283 RepID=UPI0005101969|nr:MULTISPECIES: c-type cytochrome [Comamonas]KGG83508.1 cytochrome C [Comamonas thiooxydans]KGG96204.1 cytochrome C [Comamonas thiooxydans]KGH02638.1 cytochrome C [Comamonas thiooxydans]KGH07669.1 cytochrome C [Comamonas thiooxydans]MCO8248667.1 c-type cytochrome [Comamonas thiooxydans]